VQWITTTTCYVSAANDNSPGRVAALVCRQVSVKLAAIALATFASRLRLYILWLFVVVSCQTLCAI